MFHVNFDHYSCMALFLHHTIVVYCGNACLFFFFFVPVFQMLVPAMKRTRCLAVILDIFVQIKPTSKTSFRIYLSHGTAGGIKGKIGWRDTVSRMRLKNYALNIRFPNILKVICHGKYITIIKI